jgi:chorismate mutase/prephenate dehydratase
METTLQQLRQNINGIDDQLLQLIKQRIDVMKTIGEEKKKLNRPLVDEQREQEKLLDVEKKSKMYAIPLLVTESIWKMFFALAKELQQ